MPVEELNAEQVARVLTRIGLGKYAAACRAVPLRGCDMLYLQETDLEHIGFDFRPHRRSLLDVVRYFRESGVPSTLFDPREDYTIDSPPWPERPHDVGYEPEK